MKETKTASQRAGLTAEAQAGTQSLPVMKDGEEPPDMLLALLNNVLPSMIDSQQARIVGTANSRGRRVAIVFFYDVVPTANNLLILQPTSDIL